MASGTRREFHRSLAFYDRKNRGKAFPFTSCTAGDLNLDATETATLALHMGFVIRLEEQGLIECAIS